MAEPEWYGKYRTPNTSSATVEDYYINKALTEVRIEDVLNDHFVMSPPVPYDARSWKTSCPFRYEHADGGLDKQFRVYSETNTCYCFEIHGKMDTVRLWQEKVGGTRKEAAMELLEAYGISTKRKTYKMVLKEIEEARDHPLDAAPLVTALQEFLSSATEDDFVRQFDEDVLELMNDLIQEANDIVQQTKDVDELSEWYRSAKERIRSIL